VTGQRKVRASQPTPSRPMTAVLPAVRRRQPAPVELARALAERPQPAPLAPGVAAPAPDTRSLHDKVRARDGTAEVLVFVVGGERFGLELAAVEEVIDLPPIRHVPEMPPAMLGVITVRGSLTSIYTPRQALGLEFHDGACALVFHRRRSRMALVIDDVDDAVSVDLATVREAPSAISAGVVLGVARHREALLTLLDAEALLAACQATSQPESA